MRDFDKDVGMRYTTKFTAEQRQVLGFYFESLHGYADARRESLMLEYRDLRKILDATDDIQEKSVISKQVEQSLEYSMSKQFEQDVMEVAEILFAKNHPERQTQVDAIPIHVLYDYFVEQYADIARDEIEEETDSIACDLHVVDKLLMEHENIRPSPWENAKSFGQAGQKWDKRHTELFENSIKAFSAFDKNTLYCASGLDQIDARQSGVDAIEALHPKVAAENAKKENEVIARNIILKGVEYARVGLINTYRCQYAGYLRGELFHAKRELWQLKRDYQNQEPDCDEIMTSIKKTEENIERLEKLRLMVADGTSPLAHEWACKRINELHPELSNERPSQLSDSWEKVNKARLERQAMRLEKEDGKSVAMEDGIKR